MTINLIQFSVLQGMLAQTEPAIQSVRFGVKTQKLYTDSNYLSEIKPPNVPHVPEISAKDFIVQIRKSRSRDERIELIRKFIGYNSALDFATQEMAAVRKANSQMSPKSSPGYYSHTPESTTFVAGLPNKAAKELANLQARERLTVERMSDLEFQSKQMKDPSAAQILQAQAEVERQRLNEIQKDLLALKNK